MAHPAHPALRPGGAPQAPYVTASNGAPLDDSQRSQTAGARGPLVLQDFAFIDKIAHFDRERIPERVVHAKGAGAHGYFECTAEQSALTKAKFLSSAGKRTPVFARFSTVGGEKGSADSERDPRGFAVKFYTEEGNYDIVGNNTPVFFIRDPQLFPDLVHSQKRNAQSNLKDRDAFWDFLSHTPESVHQTLILFSDRGTPASYRHMHGFGSHTFKWVNSAGKPTWVKYHFKTESGVRNLSAHEAEALAGRDPDHATRDLFEHLAKGGTAAWRVCVQVMSYEEGLKYPFDIFDVTKVWPQKEFPLHQIGRMVLDRNPENFFAETEQAAFSPSHLVPGIEPSPDKLLQGRLFAYPDTQRHRLGVNYQQIPINCPFAATLFNYQRDGQAAVNGNGGRGPNYAPNAYREPAPQQRYHWHSDQITGVIGRHDLMKQDDFFQAGDLYRRVLTAEEKTRLVENIVGHLKGAKHEIQVRALTAMFVPADRELGQRIAQGLGITLPAAPDAPTK